MEKIRIKPRNPHTDEFSVLDVLVREFEIKLIEEGGKKPINKDGAYYIAKTKPGSFTKIQKKLLQNKGNLQEWEFKLLPSATDQPTMITADRSTMTKGRSATLATDQCVLINITYSDKKAFKKLPTAKNLAQKIIDAAHAATTTDKRSLADFNYAFTITKVDLCCFHCFQTSQPPPAKKSSLLVKVEVEYPSSYCDLDGETFYYEFLSDILSDDCWICWKSNGATSDGIILCSNLKAMKKV
ncbi:PREDICTED: uncharacterized protein LOC109586319 isoform X2 [Amphimedon queenslandica]|uniref:Uncharacterized protein n=1 Tax=Amphimedon queenslandica TaxID=400682 RepID=A0AAN0JM29_AMPQE|nr:PREDICTED: uncharacterized protein LOC109586319 isoform X2 [Amphimedon queenslandica]|eukprot:XP_019858055.1 PREDICTED: uncharacterized protein LOC109586319 isoform X2 [Amphimedon queenslandica]